MLEHANMTQTNLLCFFLNLKGARAAIANGDYDQAEKNYEFMVMMAHHIPDCAIRQTAEDEAIALAHEIIARRNGTYEKPAILENVWKYFCECVEPEKVEAQQDNIIQFPHARTA